MISTIAALATPPGQGGLSVVRISGPQAERLLKSVFMPKSPQRAFIPRYMMYGFVESEGEKLDECMAVLMPSPHSYTREDVAEIYLHGGDQVWKAVLSALFSIGAVPAQPGEFTRRAFMNGRIDLSQAEAVMSLISSTGRQAATAALRQLQGGALRFVQDAQGELLSLLSGVTAALDYPDEIDEKESVGDIAPKLLNLAGRLQNACDERGARIIKEGLQVVIAGKPNVGKSSLLNALLLEERAIVTDIPGTTRDVVSGAVDLEGILVHLQDTAGIWDSADTVEKLGVKRALEAIGAADLCLIVLDGSKMPDAMDAQAIREAGDAARLYVLNKADLPPSDRVNPWLIDHGINPENNVYSLSAKTGMGLQALRSAIRGRAGEPAENALTLARHMRLTRAAGVSILQAANAMKEGLPLDLCAVDLHDALLSLGEITGENVSDALLDEVFSAFCVGK